MIESDSGDCRPFLATLAVKRTSTMDALPGQYSAEQDVWVIDGPAGPMPIIASTGKDSIGPVTKVKGERDELHSTAILELSTKTSKQVERDDVSPRDTALLPELLTKTDEIRERDDPSPRLVPELATKTELVPERDDR